MSGVAEPSARERWNERYRREGAVTFGRAPSEWLVRQAPQLKARAPGRALDLGCGGGRHALYLAELGYDVDAIDISDVAVEHFQAVAARRRLAVAAVRADLETVSIPPGAYELIVNLNVLLRSLFEPIKVGLAPGGLLVFETWRVDPGRRRHALNPGELLAAFEGLEVLDHAEGRAHGEQLREGLVARRPLSPGGQPP